MGTRDTTIYCTRDRRPKVCHYCGKPAAWLCDFKVRERTGEADETCDRPLCVSHGKRVAFGTDYCPEHAA